MATHLGSIFKPTCPSVIRKIHKPDSVVYCGTLPNVDHPDGRIAFQCQKPDCHKVMIVKEVSNY